MIKLITTLLVGGIVLSSCGGQTTNVSKNPERGSGSNTQVSAEPKDEPSFEEQLMSQHPTRPMAPSLKDMNTEIPVGTPYIVMHNNETFFDDEDKAQTEPFIRHRPLDGQDRAIRVTALITPDTLNNDTPADLSDHQPTGWHQEHDDILVKTRILPNELYADSSVENVITATKQFNSEGMQPFIDYIRNYVEETGNAVLYDAVVAFNGYNHMPHGLFMQAYSPVDNGEGIQFHVFIPIRQAGQDIDYTSGIIQ